MANQKSTHPTPTIYAAGAEKQSFAMAFSPSSTSAFSNNIVVDREPVKVIAFGLRENEYIEVMHLIGDNSGSNFEAYKPYDGALRLTADQNELVLGKAGRYRLRFEGVHGAMHCFWWQFSMTHEWANEVLAEGLRQLCECLQPPPFEIVDGPGIQSQQLNPVTWKITNTGIINASDSTTIDHTVYNMLPSVRWLMSNVKISGYEGNLLEVRPDGLYVNLSSQLTVCGIGSGIRPSTDPLPLRFVALDQNNCLVSVTTNAIVTYLCSAECEPVINLSVSKTSSATEVLVGQQVSFTITVSNSGPDDAENLLIQDLIPPAFIGFGPFEVVYSGGAIGPASVTRSQLASGFYVNIPKDGGVILTLPLTAANQGNFRNTVNVVPMSVYTNLGQSSASTNVIVTLVNFDLRIECTDYLASATLWNEFSFKFTVANLGSITAPEPVVNISVPTPFILPFPYIGAEVFITYTSDDSTDIVPYGTFQGNYQLKPIPPGHKVHIVIPVITDSPTPNWTQTFSVTDNVLGFTETDTTNNSVTLTGSVTP
jgi:uncharacterized repeat protein (TIGR01451 family)